MYLLRVEGGTCAKKADLPPLFPWIETPGCASPSVERLCAVKQAAPLGAVKEPGSPFWQLENKAPRVGAF